MLMGGDGDVKYLLHAAGGNQGDPMYAFAVRSVKNEAVTNPTD